MKKIPNALITFFFAPASAEPLAALRIAVALLLFLQTALFSRDLFDLFDPEGIVQGNLNHYLLSPILPQMHWAEVALGFFGFTPHVSLVFCFLLYLGSLVFLLVGFETRVAAALAWLLHFLLIYNTGSLSGYGVDSIAHFLLFYFIFMPVGDALSFDRLWSRKAPADDSFHRLSLRILQLHLCLIYLLAGCAKALGEQWWTGEAIWRATMLPQFAHLDMRWLAQVPLLARAATLGTLVLEIGYPFMIWTKRFGKMWLGLTLVLHASIFFVMGLQVFSLFMIAFNLAVLAVPAAPRAGGPIPSAGARKIATQPTG